MKKLGVCFVLLSFSIVPVLAQDPAVSEQDRVPDVAWANVTETLISWDPVQDFKSVTLTVSGPRGVVFNVDFPAGDAIIFDFVDQTGNELPDGHYTWELVGAPRLADWVYDRLALARETEDYAVVADLRASGDLPTERFVQNGYFTIRDGFVVLPEAPEADVETEGGWSSRRSSPIESDSFRAAGAAPADFVILDDLIVDGSACIGFDCVNGEIFGFDTLRLKENNLRIRADDTSTAASFPRNDWQITFNDSANGGADKFSIDDISGNRTPFTIEANARSHSLYIDDGGRIGSRTSTPAVEIHTIDGDTPTLRLQQDGSSGFTPQTWDVAGNETNFFIRDVTNGSQLPLRIRPAAPSNSIFVDVNGDVGMGTSSPGDMTDGTNASLHLRRTNGTAGLLVEEASTTAASRALLELRNNGNVRFSLTNSGGTQDEWRITNGGSGLSWNYLNNDCTGSPEMELSNTGTLSVCGTVVSSSSRSAKTGFEGVDNAEVLAKVSALDISKWSYKNDTQVRHIGPVSEEFYEAFGLGKDNKGISVLDLSGVALAAIQALNEKISALAGENAQLKAQLKDLLEAQEK